MSTFEPNCYIHKIEVKSIPSKKQGEPNKALLEMMVNIDKSFKSGEDDQGNNIYNDTQSYWVKAQIWGGKVNHLKDVIEEGIRVGLFGELCGVAPWFDKKTGEKRYGHVFKVTEVLISPYQIENITYKAKKGSSSAPSEASVPPQGSFGEHTADPVSVNAPQPA